MGEESTISGIVLDNKTNIPLIGANIIIKDTELGSAADKEGRFSIKGLSSGKYILIVSYIGYETKEENITIRPRDLKFDLIIKLSVATIDLQEYIITSSRGRREKITDAPAANSIISKSAHKNGIFSNDIN